MIRAAGALPSSQTLLHHHAALHVPHPHVDRHSYATATEVAVGDVLPAAMYTEGNNLIINSPPDGDVVFNGKSCRDLAVSVKAAS